MIAVTLPAPMSSLAGRVDPYQHLVVTDIGPVDVPEFKDLG
jgi:hypothetical protein